jgi:hypothetical protein
MWKSNTSVWVALINKVATEFSMMDTHSDLLNRRNQMIARRVANTHNPFADKIARAYT